MDKSNKKRFFKGQSKNCENYVVSDNVSEDEEKDKNNIVNNAQTFLKSIKDKFRRCKSSVYKSKQRISSYNYQIQNIPNTNYTNDRNAQIESNCCNDTPPPVPMRILNHETDNYKASRCFPAPYVDINEILQNGNSQMAGYFNNLEVEISGQTLKSHINNLARYGWYWGPMSKEEAEAKLGSLSDGSFLVRDSASQTYLFTISFRCFGRTLHSRIKYLYGKYSVTDEDKYGSVIELIADGMSKSQNDIFSFSTWNGRTGPVIPVRLIQPVSRFTHVQSLQHLCRFVIRKYIAINNIQELPLPEILKSYLQEAHF